MTGKKKGDCSRYLANFWARSRRKPSFRDLMYFSTPFWAATETLCMVLTLVTSSCEWQGRGSVGCGICRVRVRKKGLMDRKGWWEGP